MSRIPPNTLSSVTIIQAATDKNHILKDLLPVIWNLPSGGYIDESSLAWAEYFRGLIAANEVHQLQLTSVQDFSDLIVFVKDKAFLSKPDLVREIEANLPGIKPVIPAIDAAVQMWLLVSIDGWDDKQTLEQFIQSYFRKMRNIPDASAFSMTFNVCNLENIGGIEITWTNSLQEHLSLDIRNHTKQLRIFHLSSFLEMYKLSSDSPIFPPGLLEETARTLSLLMPTTDFKCQRWIRKSRAEANIDLEANHLPPTSREVAAFPYWGKQLLELRDEYDRTEPTTLRQWVLDKRRPNQRYTFWIAVIALLLALLFGLIQSVTGILQVMSSS